MNSTVLGKRSRRANDFEVMEQDDDSSSPVRVSRDSRAKRRAIVKDNKENSRPLRRITSKQMLSQQKKQQQSSPMGDKMDVDSPVKSESPKNRTVVLSPAKINGHFKSAKAIDDNLPSCSSPSTPRRRDRIQKPITPRHRVGLPGQFPRTPRTPANKMINPLDLLRTPSTPSARTIYTRGKSLFARSTAPGKLIGREKERSTLLNFITAKAEKKMGGCLYISGPPGTGKSALLSDVLAETGQNLKESQRAYVNCMTMKDPLGIYNKLIEEFLPNSVIGNEGMADLQKLFCPKSKSKSSSDVYIVVLDEIDHLATKDQDILYKIFEWSLVKSSKLILVGIANALDLTDRFLPRLKARNFEPTLLPFLPYSTEQIIQVVKSRLRTLIDDVSDADPNWIPLMHPAAISLCAKKVSTSTGDLRKCFDICKKAIEMIEDETKTKLLAQLADSNDEESSKAPLGDILSSPSSRMPLSENSINNMCSPSKPKAVANPLVKLTAQSAPRATLAHIARISSTSFGFTSTSRLKILNLQQKAVMCALVVLSKKAVTKSVNVKTLWETYRGLCAEEKVISAISRHEFGDVVVSLEGSGVVEVEKDGKSLDGKRTPSKSGRMPTTNDERAIRSTVTEGELKASLAGDGGEILTRFLRSII